MKATSEPRLSIKFNLDGYSMDATDPARFAFGRIVGALGPARTGEPAHFVSGRHFGKDAAPVGSAFPGFVPPRGSTTSLAFTIAHGRKFGSILAMLSR